VLKQFLDFFLNNVRTMGMEFENGAGDENLQALLNFLILAEKNKGTPEGDKYRKLATDLQNGIDEVVKTNARNNTYAVINQKFQAIDKAKDGDKEALANLYKELFPSIEKVKKSDLSRQVLLSLSTYFTAKEIETLFKGVEFNGDGVINALEMSRRDIESEVKEYESTNDILAQVSQLTEKSENFSEDVGQGR
jgi:Ca2+-binding EF-hand superfamily protein